MDIKQLLDQDQFAKLLGIELLELKRGSAIAQIFTKETHLNAAKCVQGGVLFSLADFALAAAANSYGDKLALSVECDIKFMKSAQLGILKATATERHRTHKLGYYTIEIENEQKDVIAIMSGVAYFIEKSKIEFFES